MEWVVVEMRRAMAVVRMVVVKDDDEFWMRKMEKMLSVVVAVER